MSLPKQVLPIFSLVIPSSGKRVNYRPFTVREEKMLAQAQQEMFQFQEIMILWVLT